MNDTAYDALRNRAAYIDLTGRGNIRATGADRARLLHAMTTNHVEQLVPGTGCYAFSDDSRGVQGCRRSGKKGLGCESREIR